MDQPDPFREADLWSADELAAMASGWGDDPECDGAAIAPFDPACPLPEPVPAAVGLCGRRVGDPDDDPTFDMAACAVAYDDLDIEGEDDGARSD